jgi:hypothetical protein
MRLRAIAVTAFLCLGVLSPGSVHAASPGEGAPTVEGPIGDAGIWGHALWESWFSLDDHGYLEAEYFISGTAKAHGSSATAPYTTRIIVSRPAKAKRFNGTVLLDWVNVTAQFENAVDTIAAHEMLLRDGYAFVHVSAQAAGICCTPLTPKVWDPVRYERLNHPGDDYAFDIFTQVARAMRTSKARKGKDPMAGLATKRVIAAGQSQSASRLDDYVREVQPSAKAIDGFLIHGGGSKVFEPAPAVPVIHLLSELEADTEEPNTTTNYRLWEIAGSAHSDFWTGYHQIFGQGPYTLAHIPKREKADDDEMHVVAGNYGEIVHPLHAVCTAAGASFPMRYAVGAAIHHLNRWTSGKTPPPSGPRFEIDPSTGTIARDEHGNGIGGIRLPPVEVPVATYVTTSCGLGGHTVPFTTPQLLLLYSTHGDYYAKMAAEAERSVEAGFLLPADAKDLLERACNAIARWDPTRASCI